MMAEYIQAVAAPGVTVHHRDDAEPFVVYRTRYFACTEEVF